MKISILGTLVIIFATTLSACSPENATSPEQAVYLKIRQNQGILTDTIQVQPAVHFRNSIFILGVYNLNLQGGQAQPGEQHCMSLFEVEQIKSSWEIYSKDRSCSLNPYRDVFALSIGVGARSDIDENATYSYVLGETVISDAAWVDITWESGETQRVPVVNEYFVAFREGSDNPLWFIVLDSGENETYIKDMRENEDKIIEVMPNE